MSITTSSPVRRMHQAIPGLLAGLVVVLANGCSSSPPAPTLPSYAGTWHGQTLHQAPIGFTVSADDEVTSITIGHDFNGCIGSETFSNLHVATDWITCIPGPCPASIGRQRTFIFSVGPTEGPRTMISGVLSSSTSASGQVSFQNFPGCGTINGIPWAASRQ